MTLKFLNQSEAKLIAGKGVLSAIFGFICIISLFFEDKNFTVLAYSLGAISLLSGLVTLVSIINTKVRIHNFGLFHYEGLTTLLIGILILVFPQTAMHIFMDILGAIAVGIGLMQIALAFDLSNYKVKEGLFIYSGILTVLLGTILFNNPTSISAFINLLLGVFFTLVGGMVIRLAYERIKAKAKETSSSQIKASVQTSAIQASLSYAPLEQKKST